MFWVNVGILEVGGDREQGPRARRGMTPWLDLSSTKTY